jgi:hypothetical protein
MNLRLMKVRLITRQVRVPIAAVLVARFDDLTWEPVTQSDPHELVVVQSTGTSPSGTAVIRGRSR